MNVAVRTGTTRSPRDTSALTFTLTSAQGETIVVLTEVQGRKAESKTLERECETLVKHSLAETTGDAAQRLDGTLKELNGLFKGLLLSKVVEDIHMIVAIFDTGGTLHVSHAGRAEAYLVRKGVASQITEYTSGKPTPAFVHIASGQLEPRDVVVFATQRLLRTLTPAQLAQLSQQTDTLIEGIVRALETDGENAALGTLVVTPHPSRSGVAVSPRTPSRGARTAMRGTSLASASAASAASALRSVQGVLPSGETVAAFFRGAGKSIAALAGSSDRTERIRSAFTGFLSDLTHPKRKKRAHFLLLAGALALLLVVWATVHLFTFSQRSKTRAELQQLVETIDADIQSAENYRLMGDIERANGILQNAEKSANQVLTSEAGMFRVEAHNLLGRIRAKREEINNIIRLSAPSIAANLANKEPDIVAEGLIGVKDGELVAYDRQDYYRILLNSVEEGIRVSDDQLVIDGEYFPRSQTLIFHTTGNGIVEVSGGQATTMKTDDPSGWVQGKDIETYLRFLYVLAPEQKQIYKYERINNRYSAPVQYNVNGDLTGAIDMAIDGNVYVLKEGGTIVKLFRGEKQNFTIRNMPEGLLKNATKIFKLAEKNFYILDPVQGRVIVLSDGGANGESAYLRQYVLDSEQVTELKGLYVDPEETRLYVSDEKRVYVVEVSQ